MCDSHNHDHFKGNSALEHLKIARGETKLKLRENHAITPSNPLMSFLDNIKESAVIFSLFGLLSFFSDAITPLLFFLFCLGFLVWKTARAVFYSWNHLDKLHRVIEEEQYEITHHRAQEKEELIELYKLKGFKGDLLDQVINVLMADDNRLLAVMLEEELGLELEGEEHPIKSGIGAFCGVFIATLCALSGFYFFHLIGLLSLMVPLFIVAAALRAKWEKAHILHATVWALASFFIAAATLYFLGNFLQ